MRDDDEQLLDEILSEARDVRKLALLLGDYYHNLDRANRTPRTVLIFHLWLTVTILMQVTAEETQVRKAALQRQLRHLRAEARRAETDTAALKAKRDRMAAEVERLQQEFQNRRHEHAREGGLTERPE